MVYCVWQKISFVSLKPRPLTVFLHLISYLRHICTCFFFVLLGFTKSYVLINFARMEPPLELSSQEVLVERSRHGSILLGAHPSTVS